MHKKSNTSKILYMIICALTSSMVLFEFTRAWFLFIAFGIATYLYAIGDK